MVNDFFENIREIEEMNMQISSYLTLKKQVRGDSGREGWSLMRITINKPSIYTKLKFKGWKRGY